MSTKTIYDRRKSINAHGCPLPAPVWFHATAGSDGDFGAMVAVMAASDTAGASAGGDGGGGASGGGASGAGSA